MWQTECLVGTIEADMATKILIKNVMSASEWKIYIYIYINFNEKNVGELKTKKIKSRWSWTWTNLGTLISNQNLAN